MSLLKKQTQTEGTTEPVAEAPKGKMHKVGLAFSNLISVIGLVAAYLMTLTGMFLAGSRSIVTRMIDSANAGKDMATPASQVWLFLLLVILAQVFAVTCLLRLTGIARKPLVKKILFFVHWAIIILSVIFLIWYLISAAGLRSDLKSDFKKLELVGINFGQQVNVPLLLLTLISNILLPAFYAVHELLPILADRKAKQAAMAAQLAQAAAQNPPPPQSQPEYYAQPEQPYYQGAAPQSQPDYYQEAAPQGQPAYPQAQPPHPQQGQTYYQPYENPRGPEQR